MVFTWVWWCITGKRDGGFGGVRGGCGGSRGDGGGSRGGGGRRPPYPSAEIMLAKKEKGGSKRKGNEGVEIA